jgi:hypothetical protein
MIQDKLENKKILFISVKTFNYEIEIADKLRELGARVDYFDERPSNSVLTKAVIRLRRSLFQKKINSYYNNILQKIEHKKYDYFLLIKGEVIPSFFLKKLKSSQQECIFIFYNWDSYENNPNAISIFNFFDRRFTFDPQDAKGFNLDFRPLFFIDRYKKINESRNPKYKVLFLGTAHSDRYRISNYIKKWSAQNNYSTFMYYYMQSRLVYFLKSNFDKSYMGVKDFNYKDISFKSLNINEIINYYENSSIILDVNLPNQRGLTMRTFEAFGAGKKIITTNKEILKYSFYDPNNIFVIDREDIELSIDFFESNSNPIDEEMLYQMSISGWIESIFFKNKSDYWFR